MGAAVTGPVTLSDPMGSMVIWFGSRGAPRGGRGVGDGSAGDAALVEVIRSPEALLLVAVNTNATGYSNLLCHGKCSSFLCIFF